MATINVLYTCDACRMRNMVVAVPARTTGDVVEWLEMIALPLLERDHHTRSPQCWADSFTYIKIPIAGAERIGGPALH